MLPMPTTLPPPLRAFAAMQSILLLAGVVVLLAQLAALLLKGSRHLAWLSNLTLGAGAVVAAAGIGVLLTVLQG